MNDPQHDPLTGINDGSITADDMLRRGPHNPKPECSVCVLGRASLPDLCPFREVKRAAGTVLLDQGVVPETVWYIKEGTVLLSSVSTGGEETVCALRGKGHLIGLETLRGAPAEHQAWALSDVVVCGLGANQFNGWVGDLGSPMGAVLRLALADGALRRDERVALVGRSVVRLARFLLERRRVEGTDAPLPVQLQVLARMLGMRAETLSRALAQLRTAGALAAGRAVRVADPAALARVAGDVDAA